MGIAVTENELSAALPGSWVVAATNFPTWLSGARLAPRFSYELQSADPLVLSDDVSWETPDGATKHLVGTDTWTGEGFVWHGRGLQRLMSSHWSVAALSADRDIAVVSFSRSLVRHAGIDVIVREGARPTELRATIAHNTKDYGLTAEDFASLSWFDWHVPAAS